MRRDSRNKPQAYAHRVECALQAQKCLLRMLHQLNVFLIEQQGVDWKRARRVLRPLQYDLRQAVRWMQKIRGG
jgi:hypothetical protein